MLRLSHCCLLSLALATLVCSGAGTFRGRSFPGGVNLLHTVKLRIYGSSLDDWAAYVLDSDADRVLNDIRFEPSKPTVFYFHGYTENADKESVRTVMSAFIAQGVYNAILVDWSKVAAPIYPIPLMLVSEVGRMLSVKLDEWHVSGALKMTKVYLVGHSLGGQAAGFAGKFVTKAKVPRITVLDAALPGFNAQALTATHVTSTDADFVDAIHTDGGNYGVAYSTGTVDFFPNMGDRLQPGCVANATPLSDDDFCSHWRSWRFFAESLNSSATPFYSVACSSRAAFLSGECSNNQRVPMGYNVPSTAQGNYYLLTAAASPYAMGEAGVNLSAKKMRSRSRNTRRRFWFF